LKNSLKALLLVVIMFTNYLLVESIPVQRIDWSSFFPNAQTQNSEEHWFDTSTQYLFVELPSSDMADEWLDNSDILNYYELEEKSRLYLLIFDRKQQVSLLDKIDGYERSGTSVIGLEIMKSFTQEISYYAMYIVPFMLLLLLFITSVEYWINMLIEITAYHLFLAFSVYISAFKIDAASLMALVFLIIYAFTLFNYLHSGEIKRSTLAFGIVISVITTAISSLFLFFSDFGLISSFGSMMLLGLGVLLFYTISRLYLISNFHFPFSFIGKEFLHKKIYVKLVLLSFISIPVIATLFSSGVSIDLNPVNLISSSSKTMENIQEFEKRNLPTLPFVVEVSSLEGDFNSLQKFKELNSITKSVEKLVQGRLLNSAVDSYELFVEDSFENISQEAYSQYQLALEMMNSNMPLFSSSNKESFITMLIPLNTHSNDIALMIKDLENLNVKYPDYKIKVLGKISDLDTFSAIFIKEFLIGLGFSVGFVFIFFLFYCRNYRSTIVVISIVFSLGISMSIHALFNIEISLMTLLSVILFSGLVTDSIVHIFICYKHKGIECFDSVTKPIILSNVSMLVGLVGMLFNGSLMQKLGLELSILIATNLMFILYIMPSLLNFKMFKKCSDQDDSCET